MRTGRPKSPDARKARTAIKWSDAEWEKAQDLAERAGLTVSEYIRRAALDRDIPPRVDVPPVNRQTERSITRAGNLLVDLRLRIKAGQLDPKVLNKKKARQELLETLADLKEQIRLARFELRGQEP